MVSNIKNYGESTKGFLYMEKKTFRYVHIEYYIYGHEVVEARSKI